MSDDYHGRALLGLVFRTRVCCSDPGLHFKKFKGIFADVINLNFELRPLRMDKAALQDAVAQFASAARSVSIGC